MEFYSVKILKCESFLIALRRNSKKWTFLLRKILKSRVFLIASWRNSKKWYFYPVKSEKILQPPLSQILAGPLQSPPPNFAEFGAPEAYYYLDGRQCRNILITFRDTFLWFIRFNVDKHKIRMWRAILKVSTFGTPNHFFLKKSSHLCQKWVLT